jgi:hypothetical protein
MGNFPHFWMDSRDVGAAEGNDELRATALRRGLTLALLPAVTAEGHRRVSQGLIESERTKMMDSVVADA